MNKLLSLTLVLLLTACVSVGTDVKQSALDQFKQGVTTQADVVKALGPAQSVSRSMAGVTTLAYVGLHAHAKAASFIPVVGLFAGGADSQMSTVTFVFNKEGLLSDMTSTQSQAGSRTGLAAGGQESSPAPSTVK